ncbi:MAG: hypothetical protein DCF19_22125 [Pseudanabaena frigida]|uniref:Uncharacterized protein n=1 Tax=Pseudanabaena frigida TaxID=945775 RepID=A0A2W4VY83_9CYAN|nr:MAG: hypothetical protein DCF19_22125 [Pseudanabaena frigida]
MRISFISNNFWDALVKAFQNLAQTTFNQSDEVRVWQKTDRFGNAYWCVYDPKTGRSAHFGSEVEVMSWIETHYYF